MITKRKKFEDTKGLIRSGNTQKARQYNGQNIGSQI
jgi:hypothetical protein